MKVGWTKVGLFLAVMIFTVSCSNNSVQKEQEQNESIKSGGISMKGLEGVWNGTINVPNQPLSIAISFEDGDEWTGTISIPVQSVKDYPLSNIIIDQSDISFDMDIQGQTLTFDGTKDKETIEGTFTQQGQSFPFELNMGELETNATEEEKEQFLSIDTNEGKLYGEVEMPEGEGPYPVVIIIPGSGPTDRDGNSAALQGKNNSLKLLAEGLAEQGVASVRYDKRGVGKNQSAAIPETELRFDQFSKDAAAWVEYLNNDDNYSKVGVIGHSQGSLVGMIAAAGADAEAFVSIAGAARPIDEVLYDQLKVNLTEDLKKESKGVLEKLKQGEQIESVSQELQSVFRPSVQQFLSSWMQYNPMEEIRKLDIPILIINGEHDLQVAVSEAEKLHQAKEDAEILFIEEMNHVLKAAPEDRSANLGTYSNSDLPLADGLIKGITAFLKDAEFVK